MLLVRSFYTEAFAHRTFLHTEAFTHTGALTQRKKSLHIDTEAVAQKSLYTESFNTQTHLHTYTSQREVFTQRRFYTK